MKSIEQSFSVPFRYQILFTEGLFHPDNTCLAHAVRDGGHHIPPKVMVVVDKGVNDCHPDLIDDIKRYCTQYGRYFRLAGNIVIVPGGEPAKNDPELVRILLEHIEQEGIDRHSYVVTIGGGAVLDLVGFAASVAHRGVRLIRVPTTVLSQNDSGIGVKNGINYFGKKNFLGVFDPPYAVINDSRFLHTLEDRDWRAGISEAVKVALIKDAAFFAQLERDAEAMAARSMEPMQEQIFRCAELHAEHIRGGDPFEKGSSRPLDFGHWAAHKLEQNTDFELRHGEAVAVGIALDVTYSQLAGLLDRESQLRVLRLMRKLGLPLYIPELKEQLADPAHPRSILRGLEEFREHLGGQLTIMLIDEIGRGIEVHEMDAQLIRQAVEQLEQLATADQLLEDTLVNS